MLENLDPQVTMVLVLVGMLIAMKVGEMLALIIEYILDNY